MRPLYSVLTFLLIASCANQKTIKDDHLISGTCESKFKEIELGEGEVIWQKMSEGTGTGLSYLITGLAYSTDIAVSFTGGAAAGLTVCSPLIAVDVMLRSQGQFSRDCVGKVGTKTYKAINPELGPKAYEGTSNWRCPNLDSVALGLVTVSECYRGQGNDKLANEQLEQIIDSKIFKECLSPKTMTKIKSRFK